MLPRFVFVGGCATGLLITDPASAPVRVTRDVDLIAELASYGEDITSIGFQEKDSEGRWAAGDLILEVMPATNCWYVEAIRASRDFELAPDLRIRLVTGPLFLATKFEAFLARGNNDYHMSQDLEDMVSVVDGRIELAEELKETAPHVRAYLAERFSTLLDDDDFLSSLPSQFPGDKISQERTHIVLSRLRSIAAGAVATSGR